jgi:hypothetical protein
VSFIFASYLLAPFSSFSAFPLSLWLFFCSSSAVTK